MNRLTVLFGGGEIMVEQRISVICVVDVVSLNKVSKRYNKRGVP